MELDNFLYPYDLQMSPTGLDRILLIGSCLSEFYKDNFLRINPSLSIDFLLFNGVGDLPESPPAPISQYDLIYVQLPMRSVLGDGVVKATNFNNSDFLDDLSGSVSAALRLMLESALKYTDQSAVFTLVSNFIVPQGHAAPSMADFHSSVDLVAIIDSLNRELYALIKEHGNVYLADVDCIANSIGKRHFSDDIIYMYSHGGTYGNSEENLPPWTAPLPGRIEFVPSVDETYTGRTVEFAKCVYRQIECLYRIAKQIDQVKIVIFDLDNTLWRGEIGDHYGPGMEHPHYHGWPLGIWEAIHHLRWRGILVAICSKNSLQIVEERWDSAVSLPFIKLDDFAAKKINWKTKAENIQEILHEVSLTARSAVFVDDNPVERNAVKAAYQDMRVIGSDPFQVRRILLWSPETQVLQLTGESQRRGEMVKQQMVREKEKAGMTRGEFLNSLQCQVRIIEITSQAQSEYPRFFELLNKTNQFNTTGKRWSSREIVEFLEGGARICAFLVVDKYSDYGLVGAVLFKAVEIMQFVMSCRVLGMDIELAAIAHVVALIERKAPRPLYGRLIETDSNLPCREVFLRAGFAELQNEPGMFVLESGVPATMPGHIRITGVAEPNAGTTAEERYLTRYPDVAAAVARSECPSAMVHYEVCGRAEGRIWE